MGRRTSMAATLVAVLVGALLVPVGGAAAAPPAGFVDEVVLTGLTLPTDVEFAPDGRIFVSEKRGTVQVFDGPGDPTPTLLVDLRDETFNFVDAGMTGIALHPTFPNPARLYVAYALDAPIGGTPPTYGGTGDFDNCAVSHCLFGSRLSSFVVSGNSVGAETVLIEDWCNLSDHIHTIDDVEAGPDGFLYVSAGDGARASQADYGQRNECRNPPSAAGAPLTPPTAQGGALQAQDVRTLGDPTGLNGAMIRIRPDGTPAPGNPLVGNGAADTNARRIVAHGLRNPFRFDFEPGSGRVFVGDVGWRDWEELNVLTPGGSLENFGWPCYEGPERQRRYDLADLNLCESLYGGPGHQAPFFSYRHDQRTVPGGACPAGAQGSLTGVEFYRGTSYPARYRDALFLADYSRNCLWVMFDGPGGPDPSTLVEFDAGAAGIVDLETGPGGDIHYLDIVGGALHRIRYVTGGANRPPVASLSATSTSVGLGENVTFSAAASSDPDGDPLTFTWDLDDDGAFDDGTGTSASTAFGAPGPNRVRVRASDGRGGIDTASITVDVANDAPVPSIDSPGAGLRWSVGQQIVLRGSAVDPDQPGRPMPASSLRWDVTLEHCPDGEACHTHFVTAGTGATLNLLGVDHEMDSFLRVTLTATDDNGATGTVTRDLLPRTFPVTARTDPAGIDVGVNDRAGPAPLTVDVIAGGNASVTAAATAVVGGTGYEFSAWSDAGARNHEVTVTSATTLTAAYEPGGGGGGGTAPNQVTGVSLAPGPERLTATWTAVPGADEYRVRSRPVGATGWSYKRTITTTRVVGGLADGTSYEVEVKAVIGGASQPWSDAIVGTAGPGGGSGGGGTGGGGSGGGGTGGGGSGGGGTGGGGSGGPGTQPGQVGNVVVSASPGTLDVRWDPVAGADDYRVRIRREGTTAWSYRRATVPRRTIGNLTDGIAYEIEVKAVVGGASRPFSATVTATPGTSGGGAGGGGGSGGGGAGGGGGSGGGGSGGGGASSGQVTGVNVTGGDARLVVRWTAVSGADEYRVRVRPVGTTAWTYRRATVPSRSVGNLVGGTAYEVEVKAVVGGASRPWSVTVTGTPT